MDLIDTYQFQNIINKDMFLHITPGDIYNKLFL